MIQQPRVVGRRRRLITLFTVAALGSLVGCDDADTPAAETPSAGTSPTTSAAPASTEPPATVPSSEPTAPAATSDGSSAATDVLTVFDVAGVLPSENVDAVEVGPDGTVWAGVHTSDSWYWARHDDGAFVGIGAVSPSTGSQIAAGPDGELWILGTGGFGASPGLQHYDGTAWSVDPESHVGTGVVGSDGTLYGFVVSFGTTVEPSGPEIPFGSFDGTEWTDLPAPQPRIDAFAAEPAVAPDGAVWIRTDRGLAWFDGEAWTSTVDLGPEVAEVFSHVGAGNFRLGLDGTAWMLYLDDELGPAWLRLADDVVERRAIDLAAQPFDEACDVVDAAGRLPLPTDPMQAAMDVRMLVAGFAGDVDGRLWTATTCLGVTMTDTAASETTLFTVADGLPTLGLNDIAAHPDGSVWVATDAGVVRVPPPS